MQIRLYLDEDSMDSDLLRALRLRSVDVITALELASQVLPTKDI